MRCWPGLGKVPQDTLGKPDSWGRGGEGVGKCYLLCLVPQLQTQQCELSSAQGFRQQRQEGYTPRYRRQEKRYEDRNAAAFMSSTTQTFK